MTINVLEMHVFRLNGRLLNKVPVWGSQFYVVCFHSLPYLLPFTESTPWIQTSGSALKERDWVY